MPIPPLPWNLNIDGILLATFQFIDIEMVREAVPPEFKIISVLPGKTIGGLFFAKYGPGSDLEYNELGVFPALVRFGGKSGAWVSNMYADNIDSVNTGRDIMGLPKEMAVFTYESGRKNKITVMQERTVVCSIEYGRQFYTWHKKISGGAFGMKDSEIIHFGGDFDLRWGITTTSKIVTSNESPVIKLKLNRPLMTFCGKDGSALLGKDLQSIG